MLSLLCRNLKLRHSWWSDRSFALIKRIINFKFFVTTDQRVCRFRSSVLRGLKSIVYWVLGLIWFIFMFLHKLALRISGWLIVFWLWLLALLKYGSVTKRYSSCICLLGGSDSIYPGLARPAVRFNIFAFENRLCIFRAWSVRRYI